MKDLLLYILTNIVDHPDDIEINTYDDDYGDLVLETKVNQEDMGKIIGKKGKIINSIRKILKVKAIKNRQNFKFILVDEKVDQQIDQ